MNHTRRAAISGALAVLALTGLVACSSSSADDPSSSTATASSQTSSSSVVAPIIADLTSIDGTTITASVGRSIDLTGDTDTFADWTATISPSGILAFTPGRTEGSARFNPGIEVLATGNASVTLTNSTTGKSVSFTVVATD